MPSRSRSFTKLKPELVKFKTKMDKRKLSVGGDQAPEAS